MASTTIAGSRLSHSLKGWLGKGNAKTFEKSLFSESSSNFRECLRSAIANNYFLKFRIIKILFSRSKQAADIFPIRFSLPARSAPGGMQLQRYHAESVGNGDIFAVETFLFGKGIQPAESCVIDNHQIDGWQRARGS